MRINSWAQSLVVSYKTRLSTEVVQKQLVNAIEKADSSASPPSREVTPKSSPSVSESAMNRDEFGKLSKAAVEEKEPPSISQQNPLVEDPWDSEQLSVTSDQ
ncbi:MAG: hypothetical protein MUD14_05680 [Hydrococcus sp. Prado102]|nr:hypothetical protein [Hydrococcus sp. Prado102]